MFKNSRLWRGLTAVFSLLLAIFIVLTNLGDRYAGFINDRFGITPPSIETTDETEYYKSKYGALNAENCAKLIADENAFNVQAMEEGAVLLRNEKNALPLKDSERGVTFFGNSVANPVYATNGGGSSFKASRGGGLYDAFKSAGFKINDKMFDAYKNSGVKRVSSSESGKSDIGEVDQSFYTSDLKNSYANEYNDVAVVLFTRYGGEGVDLDHIADADGVPLLSLHKEEEDLLKMIKASNKFKKTIVLINSPFPMDVEWIENSAYGVDACLAFGAAGDTGFIGIANILTGKADPSGHLADTYATNSLSAPAMRNFGDFQYTNHSKKYEREYVVYAEDIYVGYKYYESRYQDQVLGINNATSKTGAYASKNGWNYAEEMAYTFGYGLTYADFTQEVQSIEWNKEAHELVAKVKVTNNGSTNYSGKSKSVVQLYASLPYAKGQAQKSAIQLVGFGKTNYLAKGESEVVEVKVNDYLFATYDENTQNGKDPSKMGCYVFDEGDYYFAIGNDSHDALNNVLASKNVSGLFDEKGNSVTGDAKKSVKINLATKDNVTYATSTATDYVVSNALQEINYNYFVKDAITYLTRDDWNTYPKAYTGLSATNELKVLLDGNTYKNNGETDYNSLVTSKDAGLSFIDMKGVAADDPKWDTFVQQLSTADLATIIGETMGNAAVKAVNKPANANTDGPKGLGSTYAKGDKSGITLYVDQVVMTSTFNVELLAQRGAFFAEDALYAGYSMIFGPGADWHRTPYSGRNSEYYSEDGVMSYYMGAAQCRAMQEGGLIAAIKHFVGNDMETNRHGVSTFATEQAFREGSLRCFEGALRDDVGGALGTMTCFNRVGATAGAASSAVLKTILRNEWGFKGVNLTDSSKDAADYVHTKECVINGTDMFNNDADRKGDLTSIVKQEKEGNILAAMQEINKHYYYAYVNSNLINGLAAHVEVQDFVPWWKTALRTADFTLGALAVVSIALFVVSAYVVKKEERV